MNSWTGIGRLTKDVELRYTAEQAAVANFTVAIDRPPKRDGSKITDFIHVTVFGKQAEACEKHTGKGKLIAVEGALNVESYEKDGEKRTWYQIVARRVEFLEWKEKKDVPEGFEKVSDEDIPF